MTAPTLKQRQAVVDAFNARHKVGDAFWACTGPKGENPVACTLRTPAELLGGHTPVAWVDGVSGCVALTHLEPRRPEPSVGDCDDGDDQGHCDICSQPIHGPDLCATDVDLGTCHAACLEGSPIINLETGEPMPEGTAPHVYRWDGLPQAKAETR